MAVTTATLSRGQSPVRIIRQSRCSTMPETVWTIEVKAASGDHVARGLDGLLLGLARHPLLALLRGVRREVPELRHDAQRVRPQEVVQPAIGAPGPAAPPPRRRRAPPAPGPPARGPGPRRAARSAATTARSCRRGGSGGRTTTNWRLDVLEAELEVGVLVDGVMAGLEGQGADRLALGRRSPRRPSTTRGE